MTSPLPSRSSKPEFVARYGGVWEHSPWIAERTFDRGLGAEADTAEGLHRAMTAMMRAAGEDERLALVRAHPDLAGKLAQAGRLTAESSGEQASAGLNMLTDAERADFTRLNDAYKAKFGFPFIIAVKGLTKAEIRTAFETRLGNDRAAELATALEQVERIALLRLKDLLP